MNNQKFNKNKLKNENFKLKPLIEQYDYFQIKTFSLKKNKPNTQVNKINPCPYTYEKFLHTIFLQSICKKIIQKYIITFK